MRPYEAFKTSEFSGTVLHRDYVSELKQDHYEDDQEHFSMICNLAKAIYDLRPESYQGRNLNDSTPPFPIRHNEEGNYEIPYFAHRWRAAIVGENTKPGLIRKFNKTTPGLYVVRESLVITPVTLHGEEILEPVVFGQLIPVKVFGKVPKVYETGAKATNKKLKGFERQLGSIMSRAFPINVESLLSRHE